MVRGLHLLLIKPQSEISSFFLKLLGYDVILSFPANGCMAQILFDQGGYVCIGTGCSGLELFLVFTAFIFLLGGRWKDKAWFILMGCAIVLFLNIVRIIALSVVYYHTPQYLQFNHKYTFVLIIYAAIFYLWIIWLRRFANKADSG